MLSMMILTNYVNINFTLYYIRSDFILTAVYGDC